MVKDKNRYEVRIEKDMDFLERKEYQVNITRNGYQWVCILQRETLENCKIVRDAFVKIEYKDTTKKELKQ